MNQASLVGKICVVTGANSGIGRAMAAQLGERGATVVMVCRNPETSHAARAELQTVCEANGGAGTFELIRADLSEMAQVRRAAEEIRGRWPKVDVLVNNAGLYLPKRRVTSEGLETMFAVNHLAPFVLTQMLRDQLRAASSSGRPRVVTTSSFGHVLGHVNFEDLQAGRRFIGLRQYSNTKLMNVLFTRELARREGDWLTAHCFNPGAVATGFAQDERDAFSFGVLLARPFQRSPQSAARTGTMLAADGEALESNGGYWSRGKRTKPSREGRSNETALRLWDVSEKLAARLG